MKLISFSLLVCVAGCVYSLGLSDLEKYKPLQMALNSNLLTCNLDRNLNLDVSGINVYFFGFPKDDVTIFTIGNAAREILSLKTFDKTKKLVVFVGGFRSEVNKEYEVKVRNAYKTYPDSHFIMLDHSKYTNNKQGNRKSYERSVTYVHYIGKALAHLLAGLLKGGISSKNMHCVGHSLGGQMVGQTGEEFLKITGQKIGRITALDPAGPCFSNSNIENQVRSGVGKYVEVYHCNAGGFGSSSVLADTNFFVNKKGEMQPNCGMLMIPGVVDATIAAACSHMACIDLWAASVKHSDRFPAWRCDSYEKFKEGGCSANDRIPAGSGNPGNATGVYYLSTEGYDLNQNFS